MKMEINSSNVSDTDTDPDTDDKNYKYATLKFPESSKVYQKLLKIKNRNSIPSVKGTFVYLILDYELEE